MIVCFFSKTGARYESKLSSKGNEKMTAMIEIMNNNRVKPVKKKEEMESRVRMSA